MDQKGVNEWMDEKAKKATAQIAQMIEESGIGQMLAQITFKKAFIPGITGNMDKSIWKGGIFLWGNWAKLIGQLKEAKKPKSGQKAKNGDEKEC